MNGRQAKKLRAEAKAFMVNTRSPWANYWDQITQKTELVLGVPKRVEKRTTILTECGRAVYKSLKKDFKLNK